MLEILNNKSHNPDVLSCIANLSSDEVFTPPKIANAMLDMLPQELFSSPDTTFLDVACKSGVFLREIAKRLLVGLEPQFPDLQKRINHIFKKQLYGIAITELTSLLSRRSLYCSKYPNSKYSVVHFNNSEGNIRFRQTQHAWITAGDRTFCKYCGVNKETVLGSDERGVTLEAHAYEFIHTEKPEEIFNMKFDVVISNPPYQLSDGGGGAGKSAMPLYQKFVEQAKKLVPRYLTMIIPSRWFSGGKGLDEFRNSMLQDDRISAIIDYADSKNCFPGGVDIPGGICYFLWQKDYHGTCSVTNILKDGREITRERILNEYQSFIRNNNAVDIVKKALAMDEKTMNDMVSSRKPFGLESNTQFDVNGNVILRNSEGLGKISLDKILSGHEILPKWKVIVSKVSFEHAGVPDKDGMMRVLSVIQKLPPNSACTESYLVAGSFDTEIEADNLISYLRTKFVRFLLMQMLASMNMSKTTYCFVPIQDFSKPWTDEELYAKYGIIEEEQGFIDSMIRPMELTTGDTNDAE